MDRKKRRLAIDFGGQISEDRAGASDIGGQNGQRLPPVCSRNALRSQNDFASVQVAENAAGSQRTAHKNLVLELCLHGEADMTQGTNDSEVGEVFPASALHAAKASDSDTAADAETGAGDWKRAHADLVRLAALRASLDWDEGRSLLAALRFGSHLKLGFGSFIEYIERLFGYRPRFTQEKLRVAEALEELPELDSALRDGELSWSAVRELTRVATLSTEKSWIAAARGRTVRDVEKLVSGRKPGDRPSDAASSEAKRHTLRFEVSAEVLATFRDAMARLRRDTGGKLDDDAALLLMARQVLGGPADSGRASYQVSLTVCERCRQAYQHGGGEQLEVGAEVLAMAECDAQRLGQTHVGAGTTPGAGDATAAKAGATEAPAPTRVTQSIPPAVRRRVFERDARKCSVPGCRHSQYLDLHHIKPRAEGGDHEPEKLITLCGVHHRSAHTGALVVTGSYSSGFVFRHADGTRYGGAVAPEASELRQKVFLGLKGLGFRETDARRAIESVVAGAGGEQMTTETLLRQALGVLTR